MSLDLLRVGLRILLDEASSKHLFDGTLNSAKRERVLSAVMAHKTYPRPQQSRPTTCARSRSATKIAQCINEHLDAVLEGLNFAQIDDKSALGAWIVNGRKHISVHVFVPDARQIRSGYDQGAETATRHSLIGGKPHLRLPCKLDRWRASAWLVSRTLLLGLSRDLVSNSLRVEITCAFSL